MKIKGNILLLINIYLKIKIKIYSKIVNSKIVKEIMDNEHKQSKFSKYPSINHLKESFEGVKYFYNSLKSQ